MRRDPSLHIRKSDLVKLLNELKYTQRTSGTNLAEEIMANAKPYQITDRYLQVADLNAKTRKKVKKSMEADSVPSGMVEKFNMLLVNEREKLNSFTKAKSISKNSSQYLLLKEIAKQAYDFTEHFDITPKTDGYKEYIQLGLGLMRKYGLNRFKTYDAQIYETFDCKVKVLTDEHSEYTSKFYAAWQDAMIKHTNMSSEINIEKDLVKYSHMVYAREDADAADAFYEDWIEAQFEQLQFLNAIPELPQFYGANAKKRWERYMTQESSNQSQDSDILNMYDENK